MSKGKPATQALVTGNFLPSTQGPPPCRVCTLQSLLRKSLVRGKFRLSFPGHLISQKKNRNQIFIQSLAGSINWFSFTFHSSFANRVCFMFILQMRELRSREVLDRPLVFKNAFLCKPDF